MTLSTADVRPFDVVIARVRFEEDPSKAKPRPAIVLSVSDEETLREGVETIRTMIAPFRDFAAIANPPEVWAQAHSKVAAGCTLFADSLEGMCDSLVQVLDGEITSEAYTSAITEYTADLNEAAAQLTEGLGMMEG